MKKFSRKNGRNAKTFTGMQNIPFAHKNDWDNVVFLYGDQTINGVKTFNYFPVGPSTAPTSDYEFANKKYVDDAISAEDLWDIYDYGGFTLGLAPHTDGYNVVTRGTAYLGASDRRWPYIYGNVTNSTTFTDGVFTATLGYFSNVEQLATSTSADIPVFDIDPGAVETAHIFDFFDRLLLTTGSIFNYGQIHTKTSGYLFNGSMMGSTLDNTTILDDFSVSCDHDGLNANILRMIRRTWSGDMPNGTAAVDFSIFDGSLTGDVGSSTQGGQVALSKLHSSSTINDSGLDFYGSLIDMANITDTSYNELIGVKILMPPATGPNNYGIYTNGTIYTIGFEHASGNFGIFGTTPTTQPTALTAAGTPATGTPTNNGWGFASSAEVTAMLAAITNLETRVNELETKLQSLGIIA